MRFFRRRVPRGPAISLEEALRMIPLKNPSAETMQDSSGELTVKLKMPQPRGVLQRLLPLPEFRTYVLDRVGGFVWEKIDGERSVGDIADLLVKSFKMTREEAEISLLRYLQMLASRGLVFLKLEKEKGTGQRLNQSQ
ncbi:MAG: PqqD family protein [Nitrososphaerota archaeon]|nr:PqqD family protein [Candidatus Calditenuaceae archaeon]MDW8073201.1 PqqD family protein [Nitrososphaerota archaeon]